MTVRILVGDSIQQMRTLADASVNCCVTSPPYWGLRNYGAEGQIGLERDPRDYIAALVAVFQEVRRVMRPDGTLWLNLGDAYTDGGRGNDIVSTLQGSRRNQRESRCARNRENSRPFGLGKKQLLMMPARLAIALQEDGWILRMDNVWHKPNPMPESVTDRSTKAHEYLFHFAKSRRYYYDAAAVAEIAVSAGEPKSARVPCNWDTENGTHGRIHKKGRGSGNKRRDIPSDDGRGIPNDHMGRGVPWECKPTRNRRSVWTIATKPFRGAHFATFPPKLIEPCILAGCPEGGTVLDPFGGAGTTGLVAERLGRNAILIELNPAYAQMARERINADSPLFTEAV